MYKIGDKVLYRDEVKHDLWHEGEIAMSDALASDRYRVSATGSAHWVWRYASDLEPRTSPNELTVVINIDASAAIAELDGLGELITQRVKAAVASGIAGETADLARERDDLREELATCKRNYADAIAVLRATEAARDERVNGLIWERDEARQKLGHAQSEAIGFQRERDTATAARESCRRECDLLGAQLLQAQTDLRNAARVCDETRAALRDAEGQRDELRESLDSVTTSLDDYASGMGLLAAAIRKARGEGL